MVAQWAQDEMATVELNDKRLNKRVAQVVSDLGARCTASIPAACGGYAEMTAAYRLFDNEKVTYENVLAPHFERTQQRMAEHPVVLRVQDTTEIDVTRPQQQVAGAGPLDGSERRGAFLHLREAFTPDGTPLGAVGSHVWARDEPEASETADSDAGTWRSYKKIPIEQKESHRWLEGLRQSRAVAQAVPGVTCVCVADSEADIYELFDEPRGDRNPTHLLIRACQDRALMPESDGPAQRIRDAVLASPVLFTQPISVRGRKAKVACETRGRRQPRESRQTEVEVRAISVTLRPVAAGPRVVARHRQRGLGP